jgi:hypothetical protein
MGRLLKLTPHQQQEARERLNRGDTLFEFALCVRLAHVFPSDAARSPGRGSLHQFSGMERHRNDAALSVNGVTVTREPQQQTDVAVGALMVKEVLERIFQLVVF